MSERINIPFTNEHFVAFCEKMVGQPYWYGAVVYKCTENLRARKAKQYPTHYGSSRTARYRDDIAKKKVCADCVGLIKGYGWLDGETMEIQYGSNGMPDIGANEMYYSATQRGSIDTMPDTPGLAVWKSGHIGVYIGNGEVIEAMGTKYGVVKTQMEGRGWTHWLEVPGIEYE